MNFTPFSDFDPAEGLISPDFEKFPFSLPKKALFAFLSERKIAEFVESRGGKEIGSIPSITKKFPLYLLEDREPVLLIQAPVGAPMAVLLEERLFAYGVEKMLAIGCCGALSTIPENKFFLVEKAYRDEGTSYHYLPPSPFVVLDQEPLQKISAFFKKHAIPFDTCVTWSSDAFFRETEAKVKARVAEGCTVVDMECSALASCAKFRNKEFAQILFTADSLANLTHEQRDWGRQGRNLALSLGMEAILSM